MRNFRILLALGALGTVALAGYHVAARASTFVASTILPDEVRADYADRFPDLGRRDYQLARLSVLRETLAQVDSRYVDPARIDYTAMFKAGLDEVEHRCPEVVLRLDGDKLHVMVDRYTTMLQVRPLEGPEDVLEEARRVAQILQTRLPPGEYELPEVEYAFVNGMLSTLDPHTVLLPPAAARKMQEDNDGSFGGLGISIRMNNGELMIDYPMVGTPAFKAGLKPGDKIVKIEGEGTFNMDIEDAVSKMRGPAGTSVTISITREGWEMPRDVPLVRAEIKQAAVWGELLDGGVGFVEIPSFNALVDKQLEDELAALSRQAGPKGLRGLVLDMRDNPGGYLHQAILVADKFLAKGVVVSTVGPNGSDREEELARHTGTEPEYPIVVLMSGNSASAAEIVAGALKNQERAVILGERSFGKGSVQEIVSMEDDAQLKLTVKRYLTPGDHSIQEIGIPPDIELWRSYVAPPRDLKEFGVKSGPIISLFSRDRVRREADLSGHFTNTVDLETPPIYALRYLAPVTDEDQKSDRKDIKSDFEVLLARDLLLAAHGGRRADVLRSAESIITARKKAQETAIVRAFDTQGIDWGACTNPASPKVDLRLEFTPTGKEAWSTQLPTGELVDLRAKVTNQGAEPLCQVLARAQSPEGNDVIDGLEFYFGKVAPGQTREYTTRLKVPAAYPTETAEVRLLLTDLEKRELTTTSVDITTTGAELPSYAWSWALSDTEGGDGDGIPEIGETVALVLDVRNTGKGPGGEVTFNLRKASPMGKSVELKEARFAHKALAPGQSTTGKLSFRVVAEPPEPKLEFEISVRDNERYDYGAVSRAGFYEHYVTTEVIALEVGKAPTPEPVTPPAIELTRAPPATAEGSTVTLSGVVSDDVGVRNVIVYRGQQKVTYAGGGDDTHPAPTVPFSATVELEEGNNVIVVIARDNRGVTTTRTLDVLRRRTVAQAPSK